MNSNPKSRIENIVVQDFENEVLIYDLAINKAYCLNSTSALVYQLCNGRNSIADIAKLLSKQMNEPITEDFVWLALDGLKKENLLEESEQFEVNFNGLNRRQVIKKVGFASMIALPVISSVIAPSAAMAQSSGILLGNACPQSRTGCAAGLQCRLVSVGNFGLTCCVPSVFALGASPGVPICSENCATETPITCCSGSGITAPPNSGCSNQGLQTCICNPYP